MKRDWRKAAFTIAMNPHLREDADTGERTGHSDGVFTLHDNRKGPFGSKRDPEPWNLSQRATGLRIASCRTRQQAKELAERLTEIPGTDFKLNPPWLNREVYVAMLNLLRKARAI